MVTALYDVPTDQVWPLGRLQRELCNPIEAAGMRFDVVESLPVADEIMTGGPAAHRLLDIWCRSLENIARVGVRVVTYNWMLGPDWCRTHQLTLPDGSETLAYDEAAVESDAGIRPLRGWLKNVDDQDMRCRFSRADGSRSWPSDLERTERTSRLLLDYAGHGSILPARYLAGRERPCRRG